MPNDTMPTDQPIAVLGLGQTGLSLLRYAYAQGIREAYAYDQHALQNLPEFPADFHIHWTFGTDYQQWPWSTFSTVCLSPGISPTFPELLAFKAAGGDVVGDVELFARAIQAYPDEKIIAITGSNGKSTVTSWVGHVAQSLGLRTVVAGNIGHAILDQHLDHDREHRPKLWVLELSSFQLETIESLHCISATVLNCSEDHLDRYASFLDYVATKAKIFKHAALQVFQSDDPWVSAMKPTQLADATLRNCAYHPASTVDYALTQDHLMHGDTPLLALDKLPLHGLHHAMNALHVLALLEPLQLDVSRTLQALCSFQGLPHRVQKIAEFEGVSFIDDSKGTNVGATEAALRGMSCPVVLIVGGQSKGQDFAPLARALQQITVRAVLVLGEDAPKILQALAATGVLLIPVASMQEAVRQAFAQAEMGDAVLLSPACASLDMFRGYAHRAQVFDEAIQDLRNELALA